MGRSRPATQVELSTRVGSVVLPNPVMTASGTSGQGAELARYMDLSSLGAVVVKSLSVTAWAGNPAPRLAPAGAGLLNSVGLDNPGVGTFLDDHLPALAATGARVVASVWGRRAEEYAEVCSALAVAAAAGGPGAALVAVEANISCPNLDAGESMFSHSCAGTSAAIAAAARGLAGVLPLWAKLSPAVADLPSVGGAAISAGAEALTLVNTLPGMVLDPATGLAALGAGGGGLSGPPLHPVAVRAVYECHRALPGVPLIGVGGVSCGRDAAELICAGARAVQVGTATFADPRAAARVMAELSSWCADHKVGAVGDLVGRAHVAAR